MITITVDGCMDRSCAFCVLYKTNKACILKIILCIYDGPV